jgi:hypothetical protein
VEQHHARVEEPWTICKRHPRSSVLASYTLWKLWIHVPVDGPERAKANGEGGEAARLKAIIEKKSMINLVCCHTFTKDCQR